VISVCQPTVPVLAAVSLMASAAKHVPRTPGDDGRADRHPHSPTAVNNLATTKPLSWFENQRHPPRAAELPGQGPPVYPGFLQHTGFVAMNPDRHFQSHWDYYLDLVKGDDDAESHRSSTTSTTPCSTCRPSTTSTPSRSCSRTCCRAVNGW
jgi:poly(3-hydroxybutyrate) depolymerase